MEGDGDMTQRVLIKSCFMEDATIGNSNRMRVGPQGELFSVGGRELMSECGVPQSRESQGKGRPGISSEVSWSVPAGLKQG